MKEPPPPGSVWSRIDQAREALGWSESDLGTKALKNRTGYTKIGERKWNSKGKTLEKILARLVGEGFSELWLRAGVLPVKSDGTSVPEAPRHSANLKLLARKLALKPEQIMALWADLQSEGPLEKFPEQLQRAAFAAAYLEDRTLEDVRRAVEKARENWSWSSDRGIDHFLSEIRLALRSIQPAGSGTRLPIRFPREH